MTKKKFNCAYGKRLVLAAQKRFGIEGYCDVILQVPSGGFVRIWRSPLQSWRYAIHQMKQAEDFLNGGLTVSIQRTYIQKDGTRRRSSLPEVISRETAVSELEGTGYYAAGTVDKILRSETVKTLRTPWAVFEFYI